MVSSNLAQSFDCPEYDNNIKYKFYSLNNKYTDKFELTIEIYDAINYMLGFRSHDRIIFKVYMARRWTNKPWRIRKMQSIINNPENLVTMGTQAEDKQNKKHNTICTNKA
jgi:hypothetical protein